MAKTTIENFVEPAIRLYEQEPGGGLRLHPVWRVRATVGRVDDRGGSRGVHPGADWRSRRLTPSRVQDAPKELALD